MSTTIEKRESGSGKTVGIIKEAKNGYVGTVSYDDGQGNTDSDTREFNTLPDAQGWLELTFMFMCGVHGDA